MSPAPAMIPDTSGQDRALPPALARRQRWRRVAGIAALLAGLGLALYWTLPLLREAVGAPRSVSLQRLSLAAVGYGPFTRDIAGDGKVVASNSPTVYASSAGTVMLQVKAGDHVQRGQVLGLIDSPELRARLAQEQSQAEGLRTELARAQVEARQQQASLRSTLESAEVDLQTARNDVQRYTQAYEAGAVARMQMDRAHDALSKASIAQTHAQEGQQLKAEALKFELQSRQQALQRQLLRVQELQRQVQELALRSPVQGQVGQLLVAERANVPANAPVLTVVDLSALEVQMQVAESYARELQPGMPGEISVNGQLWRGKVSAISPEVVNGEVAARLRFDGPLPQQLRQNQRLGVRVLLEQRARALTVARGSFLEEGGGRQAYVVQDRVALKRAVRLGAQSLTQIEVLEGLTAGEQVVISGSQAFNGAERVTLSP
ncbi:efflux RND transporter periplasmic adaptor subunit [Roseateles sp. BYS180W]|uniref:Efflux RND transporter periplasmic adaptor subunit n=1 Tax=Roseateles rivi TaxID=3299028 RepID=A0ABW7FVG3_9BURK